MRTGEQGCFGRWGCEEHVLISPHTVLKAVDGIAGVLVGEVETNMMLPRQKVIRGVGVAELKNEYLG